MLHRLLVGLFLKPPRRDPQTRQTCTRLGVPPPPARAGQVLPCSTCTTHARTHARTRTRARPHARRQLRRQHRRVTRSVIPYARNVPRAYMPACVHSWLLAQPPATASSAPPHARTHRVSRPRSHRGHMPAVPAQRCRQTARAPPADASRQLCRAYAFSSCFSSCSSSAAASRPGQGLCEMVAAARRSAAQTTHIIIVGANLWMSLLSQQSRAQRMHKKTTPHTTKHHTIPHDNTTQHNTQHVR